MRVIWILVFSFHTPLALSQANESALRIEKMLTEKIKKIVEQVIPEDKFAVSVSLSVKTKRYRNLTERETYVGQDNKIPKKSDLPGFSKDRIQETKETKKIQKNRNSYIYSHEIDRASIHLIVDTSLSTRKTKIAKYLITMGVRESLGEKANIEIKRQLLFEEPPKETLEEKWDEIFENPYWLIFFFILGLLLLYFLVRKLLPTRLAGKLPFSSRNKDGEGDGDDSKDQNVVVSDDPKGQVVSDLAESIASDPIAARLFYNTLSDDDKNILIQVFETPALNSLVIEFFGNKLLDTSDLKTLKAEEILARANRLSLELINYKKLLSVQRDQMFGFLSNVGEKQFNEILENKNLAIHETALKYAPISLIKAYLNSRNFHEKRNLILKLGSEGDEESNIETFERELREEANGKLNTILTTKKSSDQIIETILEEDPEPHKLIGDLIKKDKERFARYKPFLTTFEEVILKHKKDAEEIIENIDNETLSWAIGDCEEKIRSNVMSMITGVRQSIIQSLTASVESNPDPDKSQNARKKIMRLHRKQLALQLN